MQTELLQTESSADSVVSLCCVFTVMALCCRLPFASTTDVQNYSDFGFRFQEGGSGGDAARTMNRDGCGIFPYIEPHAVSYTHLTLPTKA